MLQPESLLIRDWISRAPEGADIFRSLLSVNGKCLRPFGLLERPILPASPPIEDACYKLVLVGKSGVGKTSFVANLSGHSVPDAHCETPGIQTTKMYWPVKIAHLNKIVLMNLTFWDIGEILVKKFDHILPACKAGVDGVLFLFSFVDKGSWEEIPHLISRLTDSEDNLSKIVIGTKFDQFAHSEVSQRELRDFEAAWQIPVLKVCNIPSPNTSSRLERTIPLMNCICEQLWQHDVLRERRK